MDFIHISLADIIDVVLVALIMWQLYRLIRGTSAYGIAIGIFLFYLLWIFVRILHMELLSAILGQVIGVGVLGLVIVFQQEIRRFLLYIGNKYFYRIGNRFSRGNGFRGDRGGWISELSAACGQMAQTRTGALIIIARKNDLLFIQETGDTLKAEISQRLIETIFFKNTPLHDGAMIIQNGRIESARCVLPTTERLDISPSLGMRHRAAIGITEQTDAIAIVVSEQTGRISMAKGGILQTNLTVTSLKEKLMKEV